MEAFDQLNRSLRVGGVDDRQSACRGFIGRLELDLLFAPAPRRAQMPSKRPRPKPAVSISALFYLYQTRVEGWPAPHIRETGEVRELMPNPPGASLFQRTRRDADDAGPYGSVDARVAK